jgi:hypothetical protein
MSTYIRDLQTKTQAARDGLEQIDSSVRYWRAHLQNNPKYMGTGPDGARRDWLSVADVARILDTIAASVSDAQFRL